MTGRSTVLSCWILIAFIAIINLAGFFLAGRDKRQSMRRRGDRVPERTFHMVALLGGGIGTLLAFAAYHHKTRKWRFLAPFLLSTFVGAVLSAAWAGLLC